MVEKLANGVAASDLPPLSYEWFARTKDPETQVPVAFGPLEFLFNEGRIVFAKGGRIHDVGAGTGRSLEYLAGKISAEIRPTVELIASEPDWASWGSLRQRLTELQESCGFKECRILASDAVSAMAKITNCDLVTLLNAIHLLSEDERREAVVAAYNSLTEGGQFLVSTTFIEEAVSRQELKTLMIPWMLGIKKRLTADEKAARAVLLKGARLVMWPARKYQELLVEAGFEVAVSELKEMRFTFESCRGICHYPPWNEHILPGIAPERAVEVMIGAFEEAWQASGREKEAISPRNTLVIVGRKPQGLKPAA